jgi:hypothetical protein
MKVEKGLVKLTELISMTTEGTFNNGGNLTLNRGKSHPSSEGDTGKKIVTKEEVVTPYFVNLNQLKNYTLNQLPPYEDIKPGGDCNNCYSFDITITQNDINDSSNGRVYVYYYSCGTYSGDTLDYMSFAYSGTYKNYICVQNCAYLPPLVYVRNSNGTIRYATKGSNITSLSGNCDTATAKYSCGTNTFSYTVDRPGLIILKGKVDIGQTYGNVPITLSYNSYNPKNEVFIGNYDEKFGNYYTPTDGYNEYREDYVGFYSTKNKTTIDIAIYSTSDTVFIPYTITFKIECPTTLECGTNLATKTYVTNVQLNVTDSGYIKYETHQGTTFKYLNVGSIALGDCLVYESLAVGIPMADLPTYQVLYTGNTCNAGLSDCSNITFVSNNDFDVLVGWTSCLGVWKLRTLVPNEIFTTCGYINSAYGTASISYGLSCSDTTVTPSDIVYNDVNAEYHLNGWFTTALTNNNWVCVGVPISFYYVPGVILGPPLYVFQDAQGTPFDAPYFVFSSFGFVTATSYDKTTGKVGNDTLYTCLP